MRHRPADRFAGGYQDPTGLYHFAARYYDPNIGRFTSPDPSGQEKNPYLYAAGDPVNEIDPTGLLFGIDLDINWGCLASGLGAVGGGLAAAGTVLAAPASGGTTLIATGTLLAGAGSAASGMETCA